MAEQRHDRLFPFDDAMAFGFGRLKLSSAQFWAMTPRELRAASRAFHKPPMQDRMSVTRLAELILQYPDLDQAE